MVAPDRGTRPVVKPNLEQTRWAHRYRLALGKYLLPGSGARLASAAKLGSQAVDLRLDTMDVARIHTDALSTLSAKQATPLPPGAMAARSNRFFTEALVPIETTHRAARDTETKVLQTEKLLHRRQQEADNAAQQLNRSVSQRLVASAALKRSDQRQNMLVEESRKLQQELQTQLHQMLHVQEGQNKKISERLHEDVAQILVALKIRLAVMDSVALDNMDVLKKEVAATRNLVKQSNRVLVRLNDECGAPKTK